MANSLKIKSGTRAQIEAAAGASGLTAGAPYLITDEGRIAVGTGAGTFSAMALQAEITSEQRRIGQYTSTDTTTDINVAAWGIVPFNQVISEDDGFSLSGGVVSVSNAGRYRLFASIAFGSTVVRIAPAVGVFLNGTLIGRTGRTGYIRSTAGHNSASCSVMEIVDLEVGDEVSVRSILAGATGNANLLAGESLFAVEQLSALIPVDETITNVDGGTY